MKILHVSDLHIGKKIMGRERSAEYRAVFDELCSICGRETVELVLIAGDIFDVYTPSAEAEEIFYSGVKALSKNCAVLIISGNHDDNVRLSAASSLAEELNVYICGCGNVINCGKHGNVYPVSSGENWVVFTNGGEIVYINALAYPNEARMKEGRTDETFSEKMTRWIAMGEKGKEQFEERVPSIFLSHLFIAGGAVSDSEREIDLGGARAVPLSLLPDCDYCALGHLHRRQKLGENVYYCGAPMRFTFDESGAEKSVNVFDLTADGVQNFKQIPFVNIKQLVRLQAADAAEGVKLLKMYPESYCELTLTLSEPLTPSESAALRENENLVSLRAVALGGQSEYERVSYKNKSSSQLFTEYYKLRYSKDVPEELLALYLSLTEEE